MSSQPVAQPTYIFRGHSAQIHSLSFLRRNSRLLTGDADGWTVLWGLATKRPTAVWRAHEGPVLGLEGWGDGRIITHGRDHKLNVWELHSADEQSFSTILPIDEEIQYRKQPWLHHSLAVNALNFCSFASCDPSSSLVGPGHENEAAKVNGSLLLSVPSTKDAEIDIFELPSETRLQTVPAVAETKTEMVMALKLLWQNRLLVLAAYESGHTCIHQQSEADNAWHVSYKSQPHTQPVLSLDCVPTLDCYFTSSADANVARHPLTHELSPTTSPSPLQVVQTKHSGQQCLRVRSDGRIFATAGWDARVRVYSAKTMKELAVLKWHKDGCYAVAFAHIYDDPGTSEQHSEDNTARALPEPERSIMNGQEPMSSSMTVKQKRDDKAQFTHWLAAGSKDGKVSLWSIY